MVIPNIPREASLNYLVFAKTIMSLYEEKAKEYNQSAVKLEMNLSTSRNILRDASL
jgi:hypothetical protein